MTLKTFYKAMNANGPLKVLGGCEHWIAQTVWLNETYLVDQT